MEKGTATMAAVSVAGSWVADQWAIQLFGVPLSVVLASFAGAFLALSWQRKLPPTAKCASVWIGTFAGAYLTPIVLHYSAVPGHFELAIAFAVGIVAEPALHRIWQTVPQLVDKRTGVKP
jgi:ABC-type uncharacterized transport system permease subunit